MRTLTLMAAVAAALGGCPKDRDQPVGPAVDAAKVVRVKPRASTDPALADIVYDRAAPQDPARQPSTPDGAPAEVTVRSILIRYLSAKGAAGVTRSKVVARRRAELLVKVARSRGADFAELAGKYSEDPAKDKGLTSRVAPYDKSWAKVGFTIGLGQVADVVDAPAGLRVVRRVVPEEYSSAHILVMFKGSLIAPVGLKRSKADARKKAEGVLKRVNKGGTRFSVLAARYSDSPSGSLRGGVIAPLIAGQIKEVMQPYLEALKKTKVGEIHPEVVETGYGFHVIKRLPLRKVYVQHLLVAHNSSVKFEPKKSRDKWTAKQLAATLKKKATAAGADFDALVREHSDDDETAEMGGRLPPASPGEMLPRLEQFSFALKVGQVSQPVETQFGWHLIKRLR